MLEEKLNDIILATEHQITLIKIKLKHTKKDLKQLRKMIKDTEYLDMERIQEDEIKLSNEFSELDTRLYKLKKVLYRLRVCEKILNKEM